MPLWDVLCHAVIGNRIIQKVAFSSTSCFPFPAFFRGRREAGRFCPTLIEPEHHWQTEKHDRQGTQHMPW